MLILYFGVNVSSARNPTEKSDFRSEHLHVPETERYSSTFLRQSPSSGRDLGNGWGFVRSNWCRYHLCTRPSDEHCEARARQMLQRCDKYCDCSDDNRRPPTKVWIQGKVVEISDLPRWCDKKRCAKSGTKRCPVRARNRWVRCGDPDCVCNIWNGYSYYELCAAFPENEICLGVEWPSVASPVD